MHPILRRSRITAVTAVASAAVLAGGHTASAATEAYSLELIPLNNSGVRGGATFVLDTDTRQLAVDFFATGLEDVTGIGQVHPLHVHGLGENSPGGAGDPPSLGQPVDSVTPTAADDSDNDGFIEVLEGLPRYGNILMPLESDGGRGGFSGAPGGEIRFTEVYDLDAPGVLEDPLAPDLEITYDDIADLELREVVLHGLTLEQGDGIDSGRAIEEADGTAGYKAVLPVAAGELRRVAVPTPSALASLLGVGGVLAMRRRRAA